MKFNEKIAENVLQCPVCRAEMIIGNNGASIVCKGTKRHCFDISSGGYVNFAPAHPGGGDSKESVRARSAFLRSGYYRPAAEKILSTLSELLPDGGDVIDAGCGEGYYSNLLAENGFRVCGFDLSKFACDTAAKTSVGVTGYGVASVYALPVRDGIADAVVNIFAPCVEDEYTRVLRDGGYLIVAGAGEKHLYGLKKVLYDDPTLNTSRADLPVNMRLVKSIHADFEIEIHGHENISALFSMTPYYWRTSTADKSKLDSNELLSTTVDFEISVYQKTQEREQRL